MSEATHAKVIVIGSGPAGYTAALYLARANLEPILFEGDIPGGQLTTTSEVENFPGFVNGVQGTEMMDIFRKQAERFGTRVLPGFVEKVDFSERPFKLVADGTSYTADAVIISTGASARYLGLDSEQRFMGFGVSACATCDAPFYKDVPIVVVGGGDSAMEEASHLSKFGSKIYLIHRRDEFRASKIMQKRVMENPKIEVVWDSVPIEVLGDERGVHGAIVKNVKTGETREIEAEGFFLAIGHTPNTKIFVDQVELDKAGYVVTKSDSSETSVEGVYACGDVQDHKYRQAITAAGSGCMAALDAERWLETQE